MSVITLINPEQTGLTLWLKLSAFILMKFSVKKNKNKKNVDLENISEIFSLYQHLSKLNHYCNLFRVNY